MSVIIRLQNLPWSANAGDIRSYFNGLSIPEGGVHIIGGEQGDAFIAFSTDEDARQAMLKDNGKLKEVKIKLLLSSRTEMLRVIEQARQQAMKIHNLMHAPSITPMNAPPKLINTEQNPQVSVVSDDLKTKDEDNRRDKRDRSRSRGRSRARGSSHDQSRSRSRRDRERRRRDRSHSRSRSRSRDRYRGRRSRSKDRKRISRDRDSNRNKSRDSRNSNRQDNKGVNNQDWNQAPQKLPDPPAIPPKLLQLHQNGKELSPSNVGMPFPFSNQMGPIMPPFPPMQQIRPREWPLPPIMDPMQRALMPTPDMSIPNFPTGFPLNPPIFQTTNMSEQPPYDAIWRFNQMANKEQSNNDDVVETSDLCIEVRGLPLNVSYIDVKKLFDGLSIPSDGIKMINDTHGYRTGIAYVKFSNSDHKKSALNQNGKKVRSNIVEVLHLRDSIYSSAVDNFKPDKDSILNNEDMDIDNSDQTEEKWSQKTTNANSPRSLLTTRTDFPSRKTDEEPRSNWVILRGLPIGSNERDVYDFFSQKNLSPVQVFFAQNNFGFSDAYCRFISLDDTDKAMSVPNPIMGRIPFTIVRTTREDAERHDANKFHTQNRMSRPFRQGINQQPFAPRPNLNDSNGQNQRPWRHPPNEDNRFKKNSFSDNRFKEPRNDHFTGRGGMGGRGLPRRFPGGPNIKPMGGNNGPRFMGPRMNSREQGPPYIDNELLDSFGRRGCVVSLENIHFKADIDEIMEFFHGYILEHDDVIRRFDDQGRPTGDARVALKTQADAIRAVKELNFRLLRGRSVKVNLLQN